MNPGIGGPSSLDARIAELEFLFTHLERQAADLGRVTLEQQARIEALEKEVRALQRTRTTADDQSLDAEE